MKSKTIIKRTSVLFLISILFLSCNVKIEQQSSAAQFSVIDSLITHNQIKDASKELKKLSKKTYDVWSTLGVYKRYIKLGDSKSADKLLSKAIKKNKENLELRCVYSKFLIKENRIDEACSIAKKLLGTKYGSVYSEAILIQAAEKGGSDKDFLVYCNDDFIPVFYDAYVSTQNNVWLRNCAIINLLKGEYKSALQTLPPAFYEVNDSYFWSLVLYDGHNFQRAIDAIERCKSLLKNYQNRSAFAVNISDLISLESDCYILLNDYNSAERYRQSLISGIEESSFIEDKRKVLPVIYMDSALYALDNQNTDSAVDLLFVVVNNWPDYIPGLLKYADLAYDLSQEKEESFEVKVLRNAGIQSLEMEKWDSRRKIPVSDAIYRIQNAYDKTKNQRLQTKLIDLKYKTDSKLTVKDKTVDLWKLIEDNITFDNTYSKDLVKYVLYYLFDTKQFDDAQTLFYKFMEAEYGCSIKDDFWSEIVRKKNDIDVEFIEFAAYFALMNKMDSEATHFYECCVYDYGNIDEGELSQVCSYSSAMNLANIYYSTGKKDAAKRLYEELAGRERNAVYRSEIFYRLANISVDEGEVQNAKRAVDYAIMLNPDHSRAQLLKVKLGN